MNNIRTMIPGIIPISDTCIGSASDSIGITISTVIEREVHEHGNKSDSFQIADIGNPCIADARLECSRGSHDTFKNRTMAGAPYTGNGGRYNMNEENSSLRADGRNSDYRHEDDASSTFEQFLTRHNAVRGTISQESVSAKDILESINIPLEFTGFVALHDTLMYCRLIDKVFEFVQPEEPRIIVDLAAGSSIPTIAALIRRPGYRHIQVVSVDIDQNAIELSKRNVRLAGLENRYSFQAIDMAQYLETLSVSKQHVIVSNPPYMPISDDERSEFYLPVHGGNDGTRYLDKILSKEMQCGSIVAIRWCSLTNPRKIIRLIDESYDVLYIDANKAPFGTYARMTQSYLCEQRKKGLSVYTTDAEGNNAFTFVGSLLRRR